MNTTQLVNGRQYWTKENGYQAIWYNAEIDIWIFGEKEDLGTATGSIFTTFSNQCPNEVTEWLYGTNEGWVDSGSDIQITCVAEGKETNKGSNFK